MQAMIRVDASRHVGSGHVMRCLALAEAISERGGRASFACRGLEGDLRGELRSRGFDVHTVGEVDDRASSFNENDAHATLALGLKPDWVIVDHYGLDARWHRPVARSGALVAVVDDLADRPLHANLLVDQNMVASIHARYPGLCPPGCVMLLGPAYALLRREFRAALSERTAHMSASPPSGPVLLFLGAADANGLTLALLRQLDRGALPGPLSVLLGGMNSQREAIAAWCKAAGVECAIAHADVAQLAATARAAIVSCGMFAVELQALKVPSVLVPLSEIQRTVAHRFVETGAAVVLEPAELRRPEALPAAMSALAKLPALAAGAGPIALDGATRVVERLWEIRS